MRKKKKPFLDKRERAIALILSCLASICLLLALEVLQAFSQGQQLFLSASGNPVTMIENKITDFWQRTRNGDERRYNAQFGKTPRQIVILCIDRETISQFGPPPYPRRVYARLLRILREAGVKAVGIDITFFGASADPEDDRLFAEELKQNPNVTLASFLKQTQEMAVTDTHARRRDSDEMWKIGMVEEKPI
ncbi:MAG: CHASE2 domain-containing protein, partial [Armatimonadetes bacterium]|nr:CHASE2 domain-containing protein [Armatimonadota bacterium]